MQPIDGGGFLRLGGGRADGLRVLALAAALLAYGGDSAPAPQGIGLGELVMALGLAAALGLARPLHLATGTLLRDGGGRALDGVGCAVLLGLVWLGLARGLALGWGWTDMVRDVVPLAFLFLPVLLSPWLARLPDRAFQALVLAFALAGVLFALRWWAYLGFTVQMLGVVPLGDKGYLLNSVAVPFAAVWLLLTALDQRGGPWAWARAAACAAGGLLCLFALAGAVHRAALLLVCLALAAGVARRLRQRPPLLLPLLLLACLGLPLAGETLSGFAALAGAKTEAVGLNNRMAEVEAVLAQVGRDAPAFLLGDGWGALVSNPAVGYWRVSYTHNFAAYLLLKVGAVGLLALAAYLGMVAAAARPALERAPTLALAAMPPLLVGLALHTSFKYLCFGLLLALLVAAARRGGHNAGV